jgi:lipoprotein-anchoring transpeptidase ErfK/SrfK
VNGPGWRRVAAVAVAVMALVSGLTAVGVVAFDGQIAGRLLPGTTVEGIDVGGLTRADALAVLRDELESPLRQPVTVRTGTFEVTSTPWDLGLRVDVEAAVDRALGRTGGTVGARVWRRLVSPPERAVAARPHWGAGDLDRVLAQAAEAVGQAPLDARLDATSGWLSILPERPGRALDMDRSRRTVQESVRLADQVVLLETSPVAPERTAGSYGKVILVRTGENMLYLYDRGLIVKSWPVASGKAGYETPNGEWRIVAKYVNPDWINPGSAWARGLPARIPPGPNNPLGTHALALDAPGILIHATPDVGSIGYSASHGCVRMRPADEIELFGMVDVGTPVVVVDAGSPVARTSTPSQDAAVIF